MIPPHTEAAALRAMLGIGPPVLLDIKPPSMLTAGERRRFAERLAEITRQKDESAAVSSWRHRFWQIGRQTL
jgi:hypothetical protein